MFALGKLAGRTGQQSRALCKVLCARSQATTPIDINVEEGREMPPRDEGEEPPPVTPPRVSGNSRPRPAQNQGVESSPYAPTPETNRETASQRDMVYAFGEIAKSFEGGMNKLVDITMEAQKQREAAASKVKRFNAH